MQSVPLFDCRLSEADLAVLHPVLTSGQLASGPNVAAFERDLGTYLGTAHVVALGDMTHALAIALQLSGVKPGDEVLTLAYNCLSSNTAISLAGGIPVWVDIDPATATMSLADCEVAITPRTKALVAYHVAGYPAPVAQLRAFCRAHGIAFVEDANNALGARSSGQLVGTGGDFAVFSFYANRQVNGIEGAALVCPDEHSAREASRLRRFGIDTSSFRDELGEINPRSDVARIGWSSPFNHVNATLARHKLRTLDERLARSRANANYLKERLAGINKVQHIAWSADSEPAFWTWLIRCQHRASVLSKLKARGVQCSKLHQANDIYTGFASRARDLPATRQFMTEVLALPCGWWLSTQDLEAIASGLADAV